MFGWKFKWNNEDPMSKPSNFCNLIGQKILFHGNDFWGLFYKWNYLGANREA